MRHSHLGARLSSGGIQLRFLESL